MKKVWKWFSDKMLGPMLLALGVYVIKYYTDLPPEGKAEFFKPTGFMNLMNTGVALWKVIVFCLLILVIRFFYRKIKTPYIPPNPNADYVTDIFVDIKWRWGYSYNSDYNYYKIINLQPVCPECDNPMYLHETFLGGETDFVCTKCRLEERGGIYRIPSKQVDVQIEVERKIKAGEPAKLKY